MPSCRGLDVSSGLRVCPECGYQNGFHLALHPETEAGDGANVSVRLVCPSCSATYDVGLRVRVDTRAVAVENDAT
jgi:hypothetical protein